MIKSLFLQKNTEIGDNKKKLMLSALEVSKRIGSTW